MKESFFTQLGFNKGRIDYGKTNPMGDIPHRSQGKGEEGEETHFDGLS
jgi:hypothetical protein